MSKNLFGSKMEEHFDNILFDLLKDCKALPRFLDVIFGFLSRRTDFYLTSQDPNLQVGLPEGVAQCIVRQSFLKWQNIYQNSSNLVPAVDSSGIDTPINTEVANTVEVSSEPIEVETQFSTNEDSTVASFDGSDYYNGAHYNNYAWSQSITDVDIKVLLPKDAPTKNLIVNITSNMILIKLILPHEETLLSGNLYKKCKPSETLWSVDKCKSKLEIHLEKDVEMWWNCLVSSEPKLDLNKVDCSRPFHELSDEAQAKIEELTWNQEQKRLKKPTSDEINLEKIVKKSWSVEGSPFEGEYVPNSHLSE